MKPKRKRKNTPERLRLEAYIMFVAAAVIAITGSIPVAVVFFIFGGTRLRKS